MPPVLLPLVEHLGRLVLRQRGAVSRWVATDHGTIHCYDIRGAGTLPATVVLHGLGSAATPLAPVLTRLRKDVRRIIAPEYLGHGFSEGRSVAVTPEIVVESTFQALDQTIDEPVLIVGHSLGGALAVKYALFRPERVKALVLVSPAGARWTDEDWQRMQQVFKLESRADAADLFERLYHRPPWVLRLLAGEVAASLSRPPVRSLLTVTHSATVLSRAELGALQVPVLLLWGRSERLLPLAHLEYFAQRLPRHALIERPHGQGHSPHVDAPAALAAKIVDFSRSIVGS